ncbi:MAG TPA: YceH family protein [Kiritimatiellia bacterium]|nr:YceH family protein [Kiritimatiellia bacterium]
MDIELSSEQARIMGTLLEKEVTTPDYYPMTLNSLVNACNQKSCRDPVTAYDESTITFHLDILREDKKLASLVSAADSRVPKFKQRLTDTYFFTPAERAIICELLLRGPQTAGELRNRADRMHKFSGSDEVQATLKELENRDDGPWVVLLPRLPGHKEARYMHLLSGSPVIEENHTPASTETIVTSAVSPTDRINKLEAEVARLQSELEQIREDFRLFKAQF